MLQARRKNPDFTRKVAGPWEDVASGWTPELTDVLNVFTSSIQTELWIKD